jgi:hypothetical protein
VWSDFGRLRFMDPKTRAEMERLVESAPAPKPKMQGLGDVVARVTKAVGITPCEPCRKRQQALNQRFPFKRK